MYQVMYYRRYVQLITCTTHKCFHHEVAYVVLFTYIHVLIFLFSSVNVTDGRVYTSGTSWYNCTCTSSSLKTEKYYSTPVLVLVLQYCTMNRAEVTKTQFAPDQDLAAQTGH
jgi:hypothetical protein